MISIKTYFFIGRVTEEREMGGKGGGRVGEGERERERKERKYDNLVSAGSPQ